LNYRTILIDPPWYEKGGGKIKRGADRHYPLLKTDEIISVIKNSGVFSPADDCHLYLWVTNNFLEDGLRVVRELGFRYITNLVWVKDRWGLGQYFRGQHELCLFGVRGKLMTRNRFTPTVIIARKRRHSQKPDEMYGVIERCSYPPRLEMFARGRREGWDSWGKELPEYSP
jgi:N6-adenosine-specific RNA methylase IME4